MYVTVAPERDWEVRYEDREEVKNDNIELDYKVQAVLSSVYDSHGWVADDVHSESGSRTLHYPCMEGGCFVIIYDVGGSVASRGGRELSVRSLDKHFDGGYNDHTSEPSHHIPDLYAMAGAAWTTQESDRVIARILYWGSSYVPNSNPSELSSPLFKSLALYIPTAPRPLHTSALGAQTKKCIRLLTMYVQKVTMPFVKHQWIKDGREVVFEMIAKVKRWCDEGVLRAFGGAEEEIKQVEWEDG
ncbi:hypothetical protein BJ165DRAFT_1406905 [Panaeolus papilionaceus]|nr:hypothetical protein BJ165DRAFT_1596303 [Panaeolus papilionaceus]KAF9040923.1 hypothetical protein BJ165DRAFT_1406905 [Panaeolus papilionaceus]